MKFCVLNSGIWMDVCKYTYIMDIPTANLSWAFVNHWPYQSQWIFSLTTSRKNSCSLEIYHLRYLWYEWSKKINELNWKEFPVKKKLIFYFQTFLLVQFWFLYNSQFLITFINWILLNNNNNFITQINHLLGQTIDKNQTRWKYFYMYFYVKKEETAKEKTYIYSQKNRLSVGKP